MKSILLALFWAWLGLSTSLFAQSDSPPNIVLILVDDAGLMDFGAFGGEAQTPHIDSLARAGTMFTNLHASPVCAPSRAMLMTGANSHQAGVANLPEMLPKEYQDREGYEGVLTDSVQTIATRLKERGYRTYTTGKWHLGHEDRNLPPQRGFDRSFILAGSGSDNYSNQGYLPFKPTTKWFADGQPAELPEDFYSSAFFVDEMIRFHEDAPNPTQPFFSYIAFQAVHAPVQAPVELVRKYEDIYQRGWDELRNERYEKAKTMGIVPPDTPLNPVGEEFRKWEELSEEEQRVAAMDMAVMAGMLEAMDENVGRYVDYLEEKGWAENTVFIVTSDNGPDGGDYSGIMGWAKRNEFQRELVEGGKYYGFIGPEFATAIAAPFSSFKYYTGEGGLRVPLVISGPGIPTRRTDGEFCFMTDLAPTIFDLAGASPSAKAGYVPLAGKSMLPHIEDPSQPIRQPDEGVGLEAAACSAYFLGDYKILRNNPPFGDYQWQMYNLKLDPAESNDISAEFPLIFQTLLSRYEAFAREAGVQEMPKGYSAQKEVGKKSVRAVLNPFK